ncbi:MAG: XAC2610-related protein, partial [Aestuariivirgaceae bacterium]
DMNFDQQPDFAVMETSATGPNTPYRYFLFNAETGQFEANSALAAITAPVFDARARTIVSDWRDGVARNGRDQYVWRDGKPALIHRIERINSNEGCVENIHGEKNGRFQLLQTGACHD